MPSEKMKNVVVGIRMDGHGREILSWAIVKVAEPGDCVIVLHVCRRSGHVLKEKALLDGYLKGYEDLCNLNKVVLRGQVLIGRSVRKSLVREAKDQAAMALIVGISKLSGSRGWASRARFCAKRLPLTTDVLGIRNGRIVFRRFSNNQKPEHEGDPRRSFYLLGKSTFRESQSDYGGDYSEAETERSSSQVVQTSEDCSSYSFNSKDELLNVSQEHKKMSTKSVSLLIDDLKEKRPGWPLLRRDSSLSPKGLHTRNTSVVQWVLSLPNRFPQHSPRSSSLTENQFERQFSDLVDESNKNCASPLSDLPKDLELLLKTNSCIQFNYEVLKTATCNFSSDNLIGKGGCNHVYKGILPDGKSVVVKILKASKEAQKTFALEVDIISFLKHEHITPLLGICIVDNNLLSVYNFLPKGSLEENLYGNKENSVLSWDVRFNVAIKIAEALNYLHNECSRPVIHRDVKSSNILLSDVLEPQLSDFGLAIWGPTTTSFLTEVDIVGTFGYLAPEYFMYGKVSDKVDVYSFGVVLLELLSGRKPISSETPKGQESLVMWAKPKLHSDNVRSILDPNLDGKFDKDQMKRTVLAATLCITQAARLRPKMNQILSILKDDKAVKIWTNPLNGYLGYSENQDDNDDEVYPDSCTESHLSLALLDVDDSTSFSSREKSNSLSLEDYFKERSRSSSFDKL